MPTKKLQLSLSVEDHARCVKAAEKAGKGFYYWCEEVLAHAGRGTTPPPRLEPIRTGPEAEEDEDKYIPSQETEMEYLRALLKEAKECNSCYGSGFFNNDPANPQCQPCKGTGRVLPPGTNIPPGFKL